MNNSIQLLDFELCKNIRILLEKRLIIWGAAEKGKTIKRALQNMGLPVEAFCDSSVEKWNKEYDGLDVISPYQLKRSLHETPDTCIISCVLKEYEIIKVLVEYDTTVSFVSYWGINTAYTLWKKEYLPDEEHVWEHLLKHKFQNIAVEYLKKYYMADKNDIWILQPGKTASSTLEARFKTAGIPFMKQHTLHFPSHILDDELKLSWENVVNKYKYKKLKIVTAVREPLARDYSAFWQSFTNGLERAYLMPIFNRNIQRMYDDFTELILNGYPAAGEKLECALPYTWRNEFEWFNEEIKQYFDIDVYDFPFNKEAGYQVIEKNNVQLFIFKVEKMERIMPALCDFIGCNSLSSQNANKAENKIYHLAYKKFRKEVKLSPNYIDYYYNNNTYVNHFYTVKEQATFRRQWKENIKNDNI